MADILSFRNENGATIFELKHLSRYAKLRIIREFSEEYPEKHLQRNYIKLIAPKKGVLEISNNLITFFPELSSEVAEINRKKIYKLVAQRSEIYISNSKEKIELSTSRLLGKDLRAAVSLLYYSLHNFVTGKMYRFLSERFELDEYNVAFNEVDHFTSQLFFNDIFKKDFVLAEFKRLEINEENYINLLSVSKKKNSANPFKIVSLILSEESTNISPYINSFLEYLYRELFNDDLENINIDNMEDVIKSVTKNKVRDKSIKQEIEVKASIAFAFKSILETTDENESILWSLFIIALRLYWLRQTADYDYDFAIKTSTREISLLINAIQQFYVLCEPSDISKNNEAMTIDNNIGIPKDPQMHNAQKSKNPEIEKTYFDTDIKEPLDIDSDYYLFMTALHMDADFNYDKISYSLNFTPNITNRGKHYIYEIHEPLPIAVNIFLDKDGRWTLCVNKESSVHQILTQNDLIAVFDNFCDVLFQNYKELINSEYKPELCVSYPKYTNRAQTYDSLRIETISKMNNSMIDRNAWLVHALLQKIKNRFNLKTQFPYLIIDNLKIYLRISFGLEPLLFGLPLLTQINLEGFKGNSNILIFNIHIDVDNDPSPRYEFFDILDLYMNLNVVEDSEFNKVLREEDGIDHALSIAGISTIELSDLDKFLKGDHEDLFYKFTEFSNFISHELIENNQFDVSKKMIETCLNYDKCDSFAYATMGLWYLRNPEIDIETSEQQGMQFYKKAMEKVTYDHSESENDLKQRYYYEMALFYSKRKYDFEKYLEFYNKGVSLGKQYRFYSILQDLDLSFKQVSASQQTPELMKRVN